MFSLIVFCVRLSSSLPSSCVSDSPNRLSGIHQCLPLMTRRTCVLPSLCPVLVVFSKFLHKVSNHRVLSFFVFVSDYHACFIDFVRAMFPLLHTPSPAFHTRRSFFHSSDFCFCCVFLAFHLAFLHQQKEQRVPPRLEDRFLQPSFLFLNLALRSLFSCHRALLSRILY